MPDGIPSPNPQFPQPIKNVTGQANVKIQNKNLAWNGWAENFVNRINDSNLASITTKDGKNCLKFDRTAGYGSYDTKYLFKTNWKENTQYTISCDLFAEGTNAFTNIGIEYTDGTTSDKRYDRNVDKWKNYSITSTENKTIKYLRVEYFAGFNYIDLDTFMVEENTTATSYVPHQEQNYPFTFAQSQRAMQGTTLEDDGIHNARKHYVYTGNENFNLSGYTDTLSAVFRSEFTDIKIGGTQGKCNIGYVGIIDNIYTNINGFFYNNVGQQGFLKIQKSSIPNWDDSLTNKQKVALFKAFLAQRYANNNPVEVEYKLKTEEIIPYNETQQEQYNSFKNAYTYKDITYISGSSDELAPELKIQYWKERGSE